MPIWSKLKRAVEALLADAVKGHLQLYTTRYGPGMSTRMTRAWVTWDGQEIKSFSTIEWLLAEQKLVKQLQAEGGQTAREQPYQRANALLEEREVYTQWAFYEALEQYISLSIEEALSSSNPLIKAWAMFDRRLGKRRLRAMRLQESDPSFVHQCYQLRCQAEGINSPPSGNSGQISSRG